MPMEMILDRETIKFYAYLYDRDYPDSDADLENRIWEGMKNATQRGYMTRKELWLIAKWKSRRSAHHINSNTNAEIRKATEILFAPDVHERQQECIEEFLMQLTGVNYPVASTILYFRFPNLYPIIDFRVLEMVGVPIKYRFGVRQGIRYNFSMWSEYVKLCQNTANDYGFTVREVEKALWKCHQMYDGNMKLIMRLKPE